MSAKRKETFGGLQRRVRARKEEPEPEVEERHESESQEEIDSEGSGPEEMSAGEEDIEDSELGSDGASDDDEEEDEEIDPAAALAQVSFGALARAQASLPSIRRKKGRKPTSKDDDDGNEREDDGQRRPETRPPTTKRPKPPQRTSKHAPAEMTSKRPVSRKREVVATHKAVARDPRFAFQSTTNPSSSSSQPADEARARRAYAFLDEYRDSEMASLKQAMRKTKSAAEKEELGRALKSMQSRKEAQARRDKEQALLAEHRKHEKELVAQGKKPFYLKKSEQKRQLLVDRFAGMKKKQVDRTIERRRKKLASKERRDMPFERRGTA